jgi:hypothetical protein
MSDDRIEWIEHRNANAAPCGGGETFFMVAIKVSEQWQVWERGTWEVRWYPAPMTEERREKIQQLLAPRDEADSP